ncbi:MAG TPA: PQQ-dependent sugar dehydrogenase [Polyangia bacterium]
MNGTLPITVTPKDIGARRVVAGVGEMFRIDRDPMSGDIVVMTRGGGTAFYKLDPVANTLTPYNTGHPAGGIRTGMAFGPDGTMYTVVVNTAGGTSAIVRKGTGAGAMKTWTTMATTEPFPMSASNFDHFYAGVVVSPNGQNIYFSSGSRTDHGENQNGREAALSSAMFKLPVTASNVMLPNNEAMLKAGGYLFADGLRNTFDMAFNADGEMIAGDNGPDIDLPDEVNHIQEGKHYGFPWRFGGEDNPVLDPAYTKTGDMRLHGELQAVQRDTYNYDASFAPKPAGVTFVDPIPNKGPHGDKIRFGKTGGVMDNTDRNMGAMPGITAHRSPSGIAFDTKGVLCGDYHKAGFMVSYGAVQDYMGDRGEDLLMLNLTKNASGQYEMKTTQIALNIRTPIDVVLVDNKLYTISYNGAQNIIFEFTFPKAQ